MRVFHVTSFVSYFFLCGCMCCRGWREMKRTPRGWSCQSRMEWGRASQRRSGERWSLQPWEMLWLNKVQHGLNPPVLFTHIKKDVCDRNESCCINGNLRKCIYTIFHFIFLISLLYFIKFECPCTFPVRVRFTTPFSEENVSGFHAIFPCNTRLYDVRLLWVVAVPVCRLALSLSKEISKSSKNHSIDQKRQ